MENNTDLLAKSIFADSKLELSNPHFKNIILSQICIDLDRKIKQKLYIIYTLILLTIAVAACLVITIFKIDVFGQFAAPAGAQGLPDQLLKNFWKIMLENAYCILPIFVLLIGKNMVNRRVKYSSTNSVNAIF